MSETPSPSAGQILCKEAMDELFRIGNLHDAHERVIQEALAMRAAMKILRESKHAPLLDALPALSAEGRTFFDQPEEQAESGFLAPGRIAERQREHAKAAACAIRRIQASHVLHLQCAGIAQDPAELAQNAEHIAEQMLLLLSQPLRSRVASLVLFEDLSNELDAPCHEPAQDDDDGKSGSQSSVFGRL